MSKASFTADPRLAADTWLVATLELCEVRLMNDARYPWLVLLPCRIGASEIADLSNADQAQLWQEVNRAAAALREVVAFDKLNIGALGNIVRQLHVHVVGRRDTDAAWPGPVWGHGQAIAYSDEQREARLARLQQLLTS